MLTHDALRPRSPGGAGAGFALSVLVHALLIVALALAVRWRSSEPVGMSAELWAAVPQVAAPKVETPPPPPPQPQVRPEPSPPPKVDTRERDAQIAIEKRRERERQQLEAEEKAQREKLEREKLEREKLEREQTAKAKAEAQRKQKDEEQRKQKDEEQRLAKLREDQLKRMMGQVGATGAPTSTGTAARDAGPSASYIGRIKGRIKPNILLTDEVTGNPVAEVEVRVSPDGTIIGRRLVKASGVKEWDDAVVRAIDRTGVLPRDTDGSVIPSMIIAFSRRD